MSAATANLPRTKIANAVLKYTWQAAPNSTVPPVNPVGYKYGGWTPAGWDCSGCIGYALANDLGCRFLPDVPSTWYAKMPYHPGPADVYKTWKQSYTPDNLLCGDFLVWDTHIGVYLGTGMMVSALSNTYGTFVSPFTSGWVPSGQTMVVRRMLWYDYMKLS